MSDPPTFGGARPASLTPAQYLAAASVFGPPMEQHYSQHHMPGFR